MQQRLIFLSELKEQWALRPSFCSSSIAPPLMVRVLRELCVEGAAPFAGVLVFVWTLRARGIRPACSSHWLGRAVALAVGFAHRAIPGRLAWPRFLGPAASARLRAVAPATGAYPTAGALGHANTSRACRAAPTPLRDAPATGLALSPARASPKPPATTLNARSIRVHHREKPNLNHFSLSSGP